MMIKWIFDEFQIRYKHRHNDVNVRSVRKVRNIRARQIQGRSVRFPSDLGIRPELHKPAGLLAPAHDLRDVPQHSPDALRHLGRPTRQL
eukprot:7364131-Alexandrium_andersonii.AAC.1